MQNAQKNFLNIYSRVVYTHLLVKSMVEILWHLKNCLPRIAKIRFHQTSN